MVVIVITIIISHLSQILIPSGCGKCDKLAHTACSRIRMGLFTPHLSPCCLDFGVFGVYEDLLTAIQSGVVESCNVDEKRILRCTSLREWLAGFWFFGIPVTTRELVHVQVGQCYLQRTNSS